MKLLPTRRSEAIIIGWAFYFSTPYCIISEQNLPLIGNVLFTHCLSIAVTFWIKYWKPRNVCLNTYNAVWKLCQKILGHISKRNVKLFFFTVFIFIPQKVLLYHSKCAVVCKLNKMISQNLTQFKNREFF